MSARTCLCGVEGTIEATPSEVRLSCSACNRQSLWCPTLAEAEDDWLGGRTTKTLVTATSIILAVMLLIFVKG